MNAAHQHLVINHLPVVGSVIGSLLAALALILRREPGLVLASAFVAVFSGLGAAAAYYTGEPAEEMVEHRPGFSREAMQEHEESAEAASAVAGIVAFFALTLLVRGGAGSLPLPPWSAVALLLGQLCVLAFMIWTATEAGRIHHEELRAPAKSSDLRSSTERDAPSRSQARAIAASRVKT